jgi:hypothetical protein
MSRAVYSITLLVTNKEASSDSFKHTLVVSPRHGQDAESAVALAKCRARVSFPRINNEFTIVEIDKLHDIDVFED